ncbi:hypothetical protein Mapa_012636 [Marchantia paleacea]|nr:hypothetical protein Mapa_012636 [Marchantia paleacea]
MIPLHYVGGANMDKQHTMVLQKIKYIPHFVKNLLSVTELTQASFEVHFRGTSCNIED